MNPPCAPPRRHRRRSVAALLPAALLGSLLVASPFVSQPLAGPKVAPRAVSGDMVTSSPQRLGTRAAAPASRTRPAAVPANRPGWSLSREALGVLVLSYVGIGALAAAGIWSFARRGRW